MSGRFFPNLFSSSFFNPKLSIGAFSYKIEMITESTRLFLMSEESFPFANKSYRVLVALSIFICSGFNTTSEWRE